MSEIDYNIFKSRLTKSQQELLEEIRQKLFDKNQKNIQEGIKLDKEHLKLINFCANFFISSSEIHKKHGYSLLSVEPLYGTGLKNFDLAIYHLEKKVLILVECKTSISDVNDELNDLNKTIEQTKKNVSLLEVYVGDKIGRLEFVICSDGNIAKTLADKICEKELSICTWSCSQTRSELKLFECVKEDHGSAIRNGRVHLDENFNRTLFTGIQIQGSLPIYPIIPSSNMCNLLIHINMNIKRLQETGDLENMFNYTHILYLIQKELKSTKLTVEQIERITENFIGRALVKDIYLDESKEEKNIKNKKFKFKINIKTAQKVTKNIIENYVDLNADKRAKEESIKEISNKEGITLLDNFINK